MANNREQQTIFALATPMGRSGIAVIRISGPDSVVCVRKLASFLPANVESHRIYFGSLFSILKPKHRLDEVLLSLFLDGRSYTGEESVEISCHGNPLIVDEIQRELVATGCRLADPGEFTYRAFMNGKLDLVQAESVLSLIESQSSFEKDNALKQLGGQISSQIAALEKRALKTMAHIEADIDFSTEGLETMPRADLAESLKIMKQGLEDLLSGYRRGRVLEEGFRIVFAGAPNVGKSSLLNLVLGEDRAIVTSVAGTTRDLVEAWTEVAGVRVSWTDTAGLRSTQDVVESIGIDKVRSQLKKADLIFWVFAPDVVGNSDLQKDLDWILKDKPESLVVLLNKVDLQDTSNSKALKSHWDEFHVPFSDRIEAFGLSVLRGSSAGNQQDFQRLLLSEVESRIQSTGAADSVVLSRSRHFQSLSRALGLVEEAQSMTGDGFGNELVAMPLKEALVEIQSVLGIRYDEQIIDQIFKEFCLGK